MKGRLSEAEHLRRRRFVLENYFGIPNENMLAQIQEKLDIDCSERSLRNYYRWAENEMIQRGIFEKDKNALRLQLQRSLNRYQKIADQAAEDETKIRKRLSKDKLSIAECDPEQAKTLKDLQYVQINAEKAIIQMLEKAGITARREEIDINLKTEWFVVFGQAHMAIAYDLIPDALREIYTERCRIFEGAHFETLQDLVEGKVKLLMPGEIEGGEIHETTEEEERTDRREDADRSEDTVLHQAGHD